MSSVPNRVFVCTHTFADLRLPNPRDWVAIVFVCSLESSKMSVSGCHSCQILFCHVDVHNFAWVTMLCHQCLTVLSTTCVKPSFYRLSNPRTWVSYSPARDFANFLSVCLCHTHTFADLLLPNPCDWVSYLCDRWKTRRYTCRFVTRDRSCVSLFCHVDAYGFG